MAFDTMGAISIPDEQLRGTNLERKHRILFLRIRKKFAAISSPKAIVAVHGALKNLAVALNKIADEIRLLSSGPRTGLGELSLPKNQEGSSIMPGKVNPTQIEALTMVCAQIIGSDMTISLGGTQGHLQLNTFKPLLGKTLLDSARLLGDAVDSFRRLCVAGIKPNREHIAELVDNSLAAANALAQALGYDKVAEIVQFAESNDCSLHEALHKKADLSEEEIDRTLNAKNLV